MGCFGRKSAYLSRRLRYSLSSCSRLVGRLSPSCRLSLSRPKMLRLRVTVRRMPRRIFYCFNVSAFFECSELLRLFFRFEVSVCVICFTVERIGVSPVYAMRHFAHCSISLCGCGFIFLVAIARKRDASLVNWLMSLDSEAKICSARFQCLFLCSCLGFLLVSCVRVRLV